MKKSRWGIYLALKESGVDTSLALRGRRRRPSIVDEFLDEEWMDSDLGRAPKQISEYLGVSINKVYSALKNRRSTLKALAEKMPLEEVLCGGDIVDWFVDPYRGIAEFNGTLESGERKRVVLTKLDMMSILKLMIGGDDVPTD